MNKENVDLGGYKLIMTSRACPEQYDVMYKGEMVAYLRLRNGRFSARVPDVSGELVYKARTLGYGCFENRERMIHLNEAIDAIKRYYTEKKKASYESVRDIIKLK